MSEETAVDGLAEAAARGRRLPQVKVPDYEAISTGSGLLRVFALIALLVGVLLWFGGAIFCTNAYMEGKREVDDAQARIAQSPPTTQQSSLFATNFPSSSSFNADATFGRMKMSAAIASGVGFFLGGAGLFALAAVLRMLAFLALAIRDMARNSFFLRMEAALYGR